MSPAVIARTTAITLAVLVALSVSASPVLARSAAHCSNAAVRAENRTVLAETKGVLVYATRRTRTHSTQRVWACRKATGRPFLIELPDNIENRIKFLQIEGDYVGYAVQTGQAEGTTIEADVVDTRTRRHVRRSIGYSGDPGAQPVGTESTVIIDDFLINRRGDAAWTDAADILGADGAQTATREVWMLSTGRTTMLARSGTVDTDSLALTARLVYWTDNGEPRSAATTT